MLVFRATAPCEALKRPDEYMEFETDVGQTLYEDGLYDVDGDGVPEDNGNSPLVAYTN